MKLDLAKLVGSRIQTDGKDLVDLVDAQVIERNEGLMRLAIPKTPNPLLDQLERIHGHVDPDPLGFKTDAFHRPGILVRPGDIVPELIDPLSEIVRDAVSFGQGERC